MRCTSRIHAFTRNLNSIYDDKCTFSLNHVTVSMKMLKKKVTIYACVIKCIWCDRRHRLTWVKPSTDQYLTDGGNGSCDDPPGGWFYCFLVTGLSCLFHKLRAAIQVQYILNHGCKRIVVESYSTVKASLYGNFDDHTKFTCQ